MPSLLTCALIAQNVYRGDPQSIVGYRPIPVSGSAVYCSGGHFAGAAYTGPGGVGVIAFRGSQELEDWVYADYDILMGRLPTDQLGDAFGFFGNAQKALEYSGCVRFVVVGHSLGGGLAAVVAARITRVPVRGVTFNSPGLATFSTVGAMADQYSDAAMLRAGKAVFDKNTPWMARPGAAVAFMLEGAKKTAKNIGEAAIVDAKSTINIPNPNNNNVWNVRSKTDPVSLRGKHIGHSPYEISDAGYHPIGPLIERLTEVGVGGYQI